LAVGNFLESTLYQWFRAGSKRGSVQKVLKSFAGMGENSDVVPVKESGNMGNKGNHFLVAL
jgi:hypothetical protein